MYLADSAIAPILNTVFRLEIGGVAMTRALSFALALVTTGCTSGIKAHVNSGAVSEASSQTATVTATSSETSTSVSTGQGTNTKTDSGIGAGTATLTSTGTSTGSDGVTPVHTNKAPIGKPSCGDASITAKRHAPISTVACSGVTDPEGSPITYRIVGESCGLVMHPTTFSLSGTMPMVPCTIEIEAVDVLGLSSPETSFILLTPITGTATEVSGAYDAATIGGYVGPIDDGSLYVATQDALHRLTDNAMVPVGATNATGDDRPTQLHYAVTNRTLFYVCETAPGHEKICRASAGMPGGPLDTVEVLSNVNPGATDAPAKLTFDAVNGRLYYVASGSGTVRRLFVATATQDASSPTTLADHLANVNAGGDEDPTHLALDRQRQHLYFTGKVVNGGTGYLLYRVEAGAHEPGAPLVSLHGAAAISQTRGAHTNNFPQGTFVDETRDVVYFRALTTNSSATVVSKLFRASSANSGANRVVKADAISDTCAECSDDCQMLTFSRTNDVAYMSCRIDGGGARKLFRVSSATTSAAKITSTHALSNTMPFGDDDPDSVAYDEGRRMFYFRAAVAGGKKLFRISDTATAAAPVVAQDAISETSGSGDDAPERALLDAVGDRLFFTALNEGGLRRLFVLPAASTSSSAAVVAASATASSGSDDPRGLTLASDGALFFSARASDGARSLFVLDPTRLGVPVGGGETVCSTSAYREPDDLYSEGDGGALIFTADSGGGTRRLYRCAY